MFGDGEQREQVASSGQSGAGVRSASPAKRSRADMEGEEKVAAQGMPGSFEKEEGNTTTDFDEVMAGMTPQGQNVDAETQTMVNESLQTSAEDSMTTNTSATSLQFQDPPAHLAEPTNKGKPASKMPSIDEQERIVRELSQEGLDEGRLGHVVSMKWLVRVLSRSSDGLQIPSYPKEAREGDIGAIDNSDLVAGGVFPNDPVKDANKKPHIPLKPGLVLGEDYEILSQQAFGQIVQWYGQKLGHSIVRYAHNTAPADATAANIEYELNPPIFTIRKVPQPAKEDDKPAPKPSSSYEALRKRREQQERGQLSPEDAFRLVSSRSEKFQNFLKRAKEAADIPFATKVKIWRIGKASNAVAKGNPSGVLSPPHSRSNSPQDEQRPKLIIDAATFNKMEECEPIDGKDETGNSNYNGSSTMDMYQLFEDATLVLEEQIGGPAGGEYASDKKPKHTIKLGLPGRSTGSKAPSAAPSRGASPAPGMMTRGRQRRDGRTRGTVGLSNLGNTCYMNSALQCIRSVEELAIYFLSGKFREEINSSNPLGHGGVMAKQYANLLQNIYTEGNTPSFSPAQFKKTLGSLQPMFSGYGQQDSQEFLSFLVDAIHEDLNRIIKKPYNENPDSDDSTVHDPQAIIELGETFRANHRARNESIAMDLFNGFYKNTMECPDCGKISITFDPFSLVTVQLPVESTFTHTYTLVPLSGRPMNHDIDFDKNGSIKSLKEYIASKHPGMEANRLWMVEVYNNKIYKVFDDASALAEAGIGSSDHIFLFELSAIPSNPPIADKSKKYSTNIYSLSSSNKHEDAPEMDDPKADQFAVPVFSRQKNRIGNGWDFTLHPTYAIITREEAKSYDLVLKKVLATVSRLTTTSVLTELEDTKDNNEMSSDEQTKNGDISPDDKEISDRSASEDGYVEISKNVDSTSAQTNGETSEMNGFEEQEARPIPQNFMDPQYVLSPALRNQLFVMKYAKSGEGMHCTGLSSINDRAMGLVADRVKQPARPGSADSSTSDDESTTSTASGADANGEQEVQNSEDELDDKPDIVIGGQAEDSLALQTLTDQGDESDDLPDDPLAGRKPGSKRGQKQSRGKINGRKSRQRGYGKKDRQKQKNQPNGNGRSLVGGKSLPRQDDDEDNPYYIKLGEGIVLDWYPEAFDSIFAGDKKNNDDKRGSFTSAPDGKRNIPVFDDPIVEAKRAKRTQRKKQGVSLEECFVETGKREVLSEDNAWYCGRCKELRRATKTLEIWTIPDILVVHLKRFGGNRSFRDKIDVLVDYPVEGLDMTERVGLKEDGKEYVYDLFAVDNHYGGLGGGHYTAFAKNFYDGQWYDYNDSSCSNLGDKPLQHNAAAYLLFYRRRSPTPLGPPALQDLVNAARNPSSSADAQADDDAEESDSGEGRLGGRGGSLRSSGGWNGAGALGAGATGNGSHGAVGSSLRTKAMGTSDAPVYYGPERPPQFGAQGSSWSFGSLDHGDAVEEEEDAASDAASPTANRDEDDDGDALMGGSGWLHRAGTPNASDYSDDHTLYSGVRGDDYKAAWDENNALHLEDTGLMGGDAESNSTAEIL